MKNLNIVTTVKLSWTRDEPFSIAEVSKLSGCYSADFFATPDFPDFCHVFPQIYCKLYLDFIVYSRCSQLIKLSKSKRAILVVIKEVLLETKIEKVVIVSFLLYYQSYKFNSYFTIKAQSCIPTLLSEPKVAFLHY